MMSRRGLLGAVLFASLVVGASAAGCSSSSSSSDGPKPFTCDWAGTDGPGGCPVQRCRCPDGVVPSFTSANWAGAKCLPIDCSTVCSTHGGSGAGEYVPTIYDEPACHDICRRMQAAGCDEASVRFELEDVCLVQVTRCLSVSLDATFEGDPEQQRAYARCVAQNIQPQCSATGGPTSSGQQACTLPQSSACKDGG